MRPIDADALKKALHNFFDGKVIDEPAYILRDVFCHIESTPTVEPEIITDRIEYGTDGQPYKLTISNGKEFERPQGDAIIRNLAIAYAKSGLVWRIDGENWIRVSEVVQSLKDVPTTERPQSEWIKIHDTEYDLDDFKCAVCKEDYPHKYNFCPNCGADMRKGGANNE